MTWDTWDTLENGHFIFMLDNETMYGNFTPAVNLTDGDGVQIGIQRSVWSHISKCYIDNVATYNESLSLEDLEDIQTGVWNFASDLVDIVMVFIPAMIVIGVVARFSKGFS